MKKLLLALTLISMLASSAFAMSFNDVKNQNKPVVVMVQMHGCSACKQFAPMFDEISSKFSDKFNFVKEDSQHSDIAKTLNFMYVPAVFIIEPKSLRAKKIDDNCAWDKACFTKELQNY